MNPDCFHWETRRLRGRRDRGIDRVDSQRHFPPGWKCRLQGGAPVQGEKGQSLREMCGLGFRMRGGKFKGDVRVRVQDERGKV